MRNNNIQILIELAPAAIFIAITVACGFRLSVDGVSGGSNGGYNPRLHPVDQNVVKKRHVRASALAQAIDMDSYTAATALAALGHGIRLEIWRILGPHGSLGLPAGTISSRLAVPPSSLSFHLQQMTHGRILVQRRCSRQIIYAVNNQMIDSLCAFLANAGGEMTGVPPGALNAVQPGDIVNQR